MAKRKAAGSGVTKPRHIPRFTDGGRVVIANCNDHYDIAERFIETWNAERAADLQYRHSKLSGHFKHFYDNAEDGWIGNGYTSAAMRLHILAFLRNCSSWINGGPRDLVVRQSTVTSVLQALKDLLDLREEERKGPRRRIDFSFVAPGLTPDAAKV